jgi:hypothetical protein
MAQPGCEFDLRPAKIVGLVLALVLLALSGCVVHAMIVAKPSSPTLEGHPVLGDSCLMADEDLRHPSWARSEQARAGQPLLADPRAARWFASPITMRVVP